MSDKMQLIAVKKDQVLKAFETGDGLQDIINRTRDTVEAFEHDMSTKAGRNRTASLARKVSRLKIQFDTLGKDRVSEWKVLARKVDDNRRKMRDELDEIRDLARMPLTKWEEGEKLRVENIKSCIDDIRALALFGPGRQALEELENNLETAKAQTFAGGYYGEFEEAARETCDHVIDKLEVLIRSEKARIEIERLQEERRRYEEKERLEREERERKELAKKRAKEEKERQERLEKEMAEHAKKEAEKRVEEEKRSAAENIRKAQEEKEKAIADAKRAERERIEALARAEAERKLAEERARIEEQKRLEAEQNRIKEEQRKREKNKRHRAKVRKESLLDIETILQSHKGIHPSTILSIFDAIDQGKIRHIKVVY